MNDVLQLRNASSIKLYQNIHLVRSVRYKVLLLLTTVNL